MRAEVIHVTDHALLRWSQRVNENDTVWDIKSAIRQSKVIKKTDLLPYSMPRLAGSVYSYDGNVMFVMEPIAINEYRLVTVVSKNENAKPPRRLNKKEESEKKVLDRKRKIKNIVDMKQRKAEKNERPQRYRSKPRSVHVQSIVTGMPDLAPEGNDGLQHSLKQDSAA